MNHVGCCRSCAWCEEVFQLKHVILRTVDCKQEVQSCDSVCCVSSHMNEHCIAIRVMVNRSMATQRIVKLSSSVASRLWQVDCPSLRKRLRIFKRPGESFACRLAPQENRLPLMCFRPVDCKNSPLSPLSIHLSRGNCRGPTPSQCYFLPIHRLLPFQEIEMEEKTRTQFLSLRYLYL